MSQEKESLERGAQEGYGDSTGSVAGSGTVTRDGGGGTQRGQREVRGGDLGLEEEVVATDGYGGRGGRSEGGGTGGRGSAGGISDNNAYPAPAAATASHPAASSTVTPLTTSPFPSTSKPVVIDTSYLSVPLAEVAKVTGGGGVGGGGGGGGGIGGRRGGGGGSMAGEGAGTSRAQEGIFESVTRASLVIQAMRVASMQGAGGGGINR